MKKILSILFIVLFMFSLVSCKDNGSIGSIIEPNIDDEEGNQEGNQEGNEEGTEPQYKLVIKNKEVTIGIGEEFSIDIETDILDKSKISYLNTDNKVVAFQRNGNLKGLKAGTVTITAKYEDIIDTMTVTVTDEVKVYEKTDYRYWLNELSKKEDVNALLMDKSGIDKFNKAVYDNPSLTKVYDLTTLDIEVTADYVKGKINSYTAANSYTMYNSNGKAVSTTEKNTILANRNLDSLTGKINASYGVVVKFSSLKGYPTTNYIDTLKYDKNQENALVSAEGIIIYSYSKDGEWAFVQAENYYGWIKSEDIAKCSKEDFMKFYRSSKYLVVTGERVTIDGTVYRMGDKLPLVSEIDNEYKVLNPKRCGDGTLCIDEVMVQNSENVSSGFLPYTLTNVMMLGFRLLNTPYRWGDYDIDGRDCSSTQNAIYHCFGFVMPRNTSNQRKVPGYTTEVNGLDDSAMKNYKACTLIFTSSHVMMYIGEDADGVCYLLHNTGPCKLQTLASYNASSGKKMIGTLTIR